MKRILAAVMISVMLAAACTGCTLNPFLDNVLNKETNEDQTDKENTLPSLNSVEISENQIRNDLGVPSGENINIVYGEPYYWSSAEKNVVPVSVYLNGEYRAGADYDIDSREPVRNICGWTDTDNSSSNNNSGTENTVVYHHYYHDYDMGDYYYDGGWSEFIIPDSDTRIISESELRGYSAEALRIARNEIYARHGRLFNDKELQAYFNSCSWYYGYISPDSFSDSMLNSVETKNKDTIVNYETKMGYK